MLPYIHTRIYRNPIATQKQNNKSNLTEHQRKRECFVNGNKKLFISVCDINQYTHPNRSYTYDMNMNMRISTLLKIKKIFA